MFMISQQQWTTLREQQACRFAARAVVHLRDLDPVRFARLAPPEQEAEVARGVAAASRQALTREAEVIVFLEARCLILRLGETHGQDAGWVANLFLSDSTDLARTFSYVREVAGCKLVALEALQVSHA